MRLGLGRFFVAASMTAISCAPAIADDAVAPTPLEDEIVLTADNIGTAYGQALFFSTVRGECRGEIDPRQAVYFEKQDLCSLAAIEQDNRETGIGYCREDLTRRYRVLEKREREVQAKLYKIFSMDAPSVKTHARPFVTGPTAYDQPLGAEVMRNRADELALLLKKLQREYKMALAKALKPIQEARDAADVAYEGCLNAVFSDSVIFMENAFRTHFPDGLSVKTSPYNAPVTLTQG